MLHSQTLLLLLDTLGVHAALFMSALEASSRHEPCGPSFSTLPSKGPQRVVSFYYNAWKTRAVPQAHAWYCRLEQARLSRSS